MVCFISRSFFKELRGRLYILPAKYILCGLVTLVLLFALLLLGFISLWLKKSSLDEVSFYYSDGKWRDSCEKQCTSKFESPPLLLISLDGFRNDYLLRNLTPAVQRLMSCGTTTPYMIPSFPSITFPNHYTIVTGLYPESHGIVDNSMFDRNIGKPSTNSEFPAEHFFHPKNASADWYNGEPIWNTVNFAGKKSGTFFWPGSEVKIQGNEPTYKANFSATTPFSTRVNQVIQWLQLPAITRPSFLTMYFEQPDGAGHAAGPDSDAVNSQLIFVDAMLNYLLQRLDGEGLLGCINIVIVSDHGMETLRPTSFSSFDEFAPKLPPGSLAISSVVGHIYLNDGTAAPSGKNVTPKADKDIYDLFPNATCKKGEKYRLYTRNTMPRRYHYASSRVGDLIVDSRLGSKFFDTKKHKEENKLIGAHGFDNIEPSMRAIFGAMGPSFKQGAVIPPFQNIELYNLFVDVMRLPNRAPNNGTLGRLYSVLKNPPEYPHEKTHIVAQCSKQFELLKCGDSCHFPSLEPNQPYCFTGHAIEFAGPHDACEVPLCNGSITIDAEERPIVVSSLLTSPIPNIDFRANCSLKLHAMPPPPTTPSPDETEPDSSTTVTPNLTTTTTLPPPIDKTCPRVKFVDTISLFALNSYHWFIELTQLKVDPNFIDGVFKHLLQLIYKYRIHYKTLRMFSGVIWDRNNDGLADEVKEGPPTHVFVVLFRCSGAWNTNLTHCVDPEATRVLSFALPLTEKDHNCMYHIEFLFRNTVRVRDVELLTGLQFFTDRVHYHPDLAIRLRTAVVEQLWQLEEHPTQETES
uniref:NUC domain-containing protein n=1 Tax=Panagrellus redivivus TaxID=6233 RepID=A0A7E4UNB3_PANRE